MKSKRFECNACADTKNAYAPCVLIVPDIYPPRQLQYCSSVDWVEVPAIIKPVNNQAPLQNKAFGSCEICTEVQADGKCGLGLVFETRKCLDNRLATV